MDKNGYLIDLSESDYTQFGRIDFSAQSQEQRVFSAIWALESQVNNGGFAQFFDNEGPDTVSFAPTALIAIGAVNCADIVSRAIAIALASSRVPDAAEQLEGLESEFYGYPDNLTDLLYAYVSVRPTIFGKAPVGA